MLTIDFVHSLKNDQLRSASYRCLHGFSLLEMLLVVIILAILAAIVFPPLLATDDGAKISAAQQIARQVDQQLNLAKQREGAWPDNIQREWFMKAPVNPFKPDHVRTIFDDVDGSNNANKWHPRDKTMSSFPFWYNRRNGVFRVRVPAQSSNAETLELYNVVNQTSARTLSDTGL